MVYKRIKIWEVTFGFNYTSEKVVARNYYEAARKATKSVKSYTPRHQRYITEIKLITEASS